MAFLATLGLLLGGSYAADLERRALHDTSSMLLMLVMLGVASICVRQTAVILTKREGHALRFEEEPPPLLIGLELNHD